MTVLSVSPTGGKLCLALALQASLLSVLAASTKAAAVKGSAFIGAQSMVVVGRAAHVKCMPKIEMLKMGVPLGDRRTPLRLRGGSFIDQCLPVSFQAPTRTHFTQRKMAGAVAEIPNALPKTSANQPRVVFILGGPGAGKGTQCSKITQEYRAVKHLSAGDLLREERDSGSEQGDMINSYMKEGKIIPVKVTAGLLKKAIDLEKGNCDLFLIDGFPRNDDNLRGWNEIVGDSVHVEFMVLMECSEQVMMSRLVARGAASGRVDDNAETIRKRFDVYKTETLPVVTYFDEQERLQRISADSGSIDAVFTEIEKIFNTVAQRKSLPRRLAGKVRRFILALLRRS